MYCDSIQKISGGNVCIMFQGKRNRLCPEPQPKSWQTYRKILEYSWSKGDLKSSLPFEMEPCSQPCLDLCRF